MDIVTKNQTMTADKIAQLNWFYFTAVLFLLLCVCVLRFNKRVYWEEIVSYSPFS